MELLLSFDHETLSNGFPQILHRGQQTLVGVREDGRHQLIEFFLAKELVPVFTFEEGYSTVKGFFRQYEFYYVVADERDVVRLRTNVAMIRRRMFMSTVHGVLSRTPAAI